MSIHHLPLRSIVAALLLPLAAHALTLPVSEDTSTTTVVKTAKVAGRATTLPITPTRNALARFEVGSLSAILPSVNVTGARLILFVNAAKVPAGLTVRAVTSEWSEVYSAPLLVPSISTDAVAAIPASSVVAKRFIIADVTSLVKAWLHNPASDFGFAVTPATTANVNVLLGAKEGTGTGYPPVLEIDTIVPIGEGAVTSAQLAAGLDPAKLGTGTVSTTEFSFLDGVTSSLQGQINTSAATLTNLTTTVDGKVSKTGDTMSGPLNLVPTTSDSAGLIKQNGARLLHTYGQDNLFVGREAGNFTMTGFANTASGNAALRANTDGNANTANGAFALYSNATGSRNTASGNASLYSNTTGNYNTANGGAALYYNTEGSYNTATGDTALYANTTGSANTANGSGALYSNTQGSYNTATGNAALSTNSTGSYNTANGDSALYSNTTGEANTAIGSGALRSNTEGSLNTATGDTALTSNTTGTSNTATGGAALRANTTGNLNTALGDYTLASNTTGDLNTAGGAGALSMNVSGLRNTASGAGALSSSIAGSDNLALGVNAGSNLTDGSNNIYVSNTGVANESNTIRLGNTNQTRTFVAGIRSVTTGANNAVPVVIDGAGQLGTVSSSQRYKEDIADMGEVSARLDALRPVTFRYKKPFADGSQPEQFGLIAEEVAQVFPELCVRNAEGQPETVKYQDLAPLLLNEFQKEHRRSHALMKAKDAEIADLKRETESLKARLDRLEQHLQSPPAAVAP